MENIKVIFKNIFEYKGNSFGLQRWLYIYNFSDGGNIFATVNFKNANGVSGSGVSGIVIEISKIKWLDKKTLFSETFINERILSNSKRILEDYELYKYLKSLPKNMSKKEYEDYLIDNL